MKTLLYSQIPDSFWVNEQQNMLADSVRSILHQIKSGGDKALLECTKKYDGVIPEKLIFNYQELESYTDIFSEKQMRSILQMKENLSLFAHKQKLQFTDFTMDINNGLQLGQRVIAIEQVGIYVPGGNYPLVSTVFMCTVPAKVAGVNRIILATPPDRNGKINPYIAGAAYLAGVDHIILAGGAQAVGALAYGTETIPAVDMIVGPGNAYVTEAKRQVFGTVGIDFVAGPSEVMIVADESANAAIIAADMLAQAEHDLLASSVLLTNSKKLATDVENEIRIQLKRLSTKEIAGQAIKNNGYIIVVDNLDQAVEIANRKAPEHLELHLKDVDRFSSRFKNYGSLFIGEFAGEILGDYSAGINHTLPTAGAARYSSGLSVVNFLKLPTTLACTRAGYESIAESAAELAKMEGLEGHYNSVTVRKSK